MSLDGGNVDNALYLVLVITFLVAFILVFLTFRISHKGEHDFKKLMGTATWDFSKSWASTLTVVGALLGTALSAGLGTDQYSLLNLLFLLPTFLAPLVYYTIGKQQRDSQQAEKQRDTQVTTQPLPSYHYRGRVFGFLIACSFTLWGVFGELTALALLTGDLALLHPKEHFSTPLLLVLQIALACAALCVIIYTIKTIPWTLEAQVTQEDARKQAMAYNKQFSKRFLHPDLELVEAPTTTEPLSWSLL